jgi:transposase-like protein
MVSIIQLLLLYIQDLHTQIYKLNLFILRLTPFKQWKHEQFYSPKYQKFKTDILPTILKFEKQDYLFLIAYYKFKYNTTLKPINRRSKVNIPKDTLCPRCGAPHEYLYPNNGNNGQLLCKVCNQKFNLNNHATKPITLVCPHCNHTLERVKNRKYFFVHKCRNDNCPYYLKNLRKLPKNLSHSDKSKYKLHYIYREFIIDFFDIDLSKLPDWATSFKFKRKNAHIMGLCLTYHVNLKLSLRKTAQALKDVHNVDISHTMVANYARTAAVIIKPFIDNYDYKPSTELSADETYIKVRGKLTYIWFIMDTISRSILGYQVSDNRSVGPCILTMRMAFDKFKTFPGKALKFIADGYSVYPLAAQQFDLKENKKFDITPVIGLSNVDPVSKKFRPYKQMIERLNRTFKSSYKLTCGYDSLEGAHYSLSLWVAYYNFLRPHGAYSNKNCLNTVKELSEASNMPGKWQLLIFLGQQTILDMQEKNSS